MAPLFAYFTYCLFFWHHYLRTFTISSSLSLFSYVFTIWKIYLNPHFSNKWHYNLRTFMNFSLEYILFKKIALQFTYFFPGLFPCSLLMNPIITKIAR